MSFRLVYDSDTGRPKGFGFAEFADADAAASAVRNLDKYQIQGRELRVDYSHVGNKEAANQANQNANSTLDPSSANPNFQPISGSQGGQPNGLAASQPPGQAGAPPPNPIIGQLPMGSELPAGLTCPDAISKTLHTLPPPQLLDILSQMKNLVANDPARATELLKQAPQLSYAIFQALLLMGLVDSSLIASVVESSGPGAMAPQSMPARPFPGQQGPGQFGTPPIGGMGIPGGQAPPPPPQQQQPQMQFPPGQEDLIRQILSMPQHEIDKLGPADKAQIMALRAQFGGT